MQGNGQPEAEYDGLGQAIDRLGLKGDAAQAMRDGFAELVANGTEAIDAIKTLTAVISSIPDQGSVKRQWPDSRQNRRIEERAVTARSRTSGARPDDVLPDAKEMFAYLKARREADPSFRNVVQYNPETKGFEHV